MRLGYINRNGFRKLLRQGGIRLKIGPFSVCLSSSLDQVASGLADLYKDYQLLSNDEFIDFHISLRPPSLLRTKFRPQVCFYLDGHTPFKPLPQNQAFAMFEWGLNWCIANSAHQYLNIHAAVLEKNSYALVLPGSPGSGKSTLCATLSLRGWRLLSDEMALISLTDSNIFPVPRPVSLKNQSIELIQNISNGITLTKPVHDTAKGSVAHIRPPQKSVELSEMPAKPKLVIFPKFSRGARTSLVPMSKGQALLKVAENTFNYSILGQKGFESLTGLLDQSDCYSLGYENMEEAITHIERLFHE